MILPALALLLVEVGAPTPTIDVAQPGAGGIQQVYISVCGAAVSAGGGSGVSGSVVSGESRVCEILRVAAALDAIGEREAARALVLSARDLVDPKATLAQRASLWLRQWFFEPAFDLIPWVGSAAF